MTVALGNDVVARDIARLVDSELSRLGLLFRVFARAKTLESTDRKIRSKGYASGGRLLQDLIGVRVALYFHDDVAIARHALEQVFDLRSETVDELSNQEFRPTRLNLVFRLPAKLERQLEIPSANYPIEPTFELQLRTILAEGWHEVEHDLRYKVPSAWKRDDDLSRAMNGIMATLETCDWSMLQLFDELALRQYRRGAWSAMIRQKFRLRLTDGDLSKNVENVLSADASLAKMIFRTDRSALLRALVRSRVSIPFVADNLVFIANRLGLRDSRLEELVPRAIEEDLNVLAANVV